VTGRSQSFVERYGPWGVVAGASEGLGSAFAAQAARAGLNLLLVARREELLGDLARSLSAEHGVEVRTLALDLARADMASALVAATSDLAIGLAIYNAAYAPVGDFVATAADDLVRVVDVNVRGPLGFARAFAPAMVARRRGALVLMSSLAGAQGTPRLATYAASKAFNTVLAEGLWHELRPHGVDVVATCAGAVRTPGYQARSPRTAPGTLDAEVIAAQTLASLERGPRVVPGLINKIADRLVGRFLPRRSAIAIMSVSTRDLA
jgi:short-subunit dehydrogenase